MDTGTWPFDNAAHTLYKWEKRINWTRFANGVTYTYVGQDLYVVREQHDGAPARFSFYKAVSVVELIRKYYGERNEE